jgi:hypothetical protein
VVPHPEAAIVAPHPAVFDPATPVPGPPLYGLPYPVTAAPYPMPTYPLSAAPYPVTAAPYPMTPAPYPITPAPYPFGLAAPPPRSPMVVVLGIATGVLLVAAVALSGLWFLDHDEATRASSEQQAQLEQLREEVGQLEEDLDATETQLQRSEEDLVTAQACPDAVQEFIDRAGDAALEGETGPLMAAAEQAALDMIDACQTAP